MVIVVAENTVPAEKRAEYMEAVAKSGILEATHAEAGCISYDLAASAANPECVYIVERWESLELIQAHMKGANFAAISEINKKFVTAGKFDMYNGNKIA